MKLINIVGNPIKNIREYYSLIRHPIARINELNRMYAERYGLSPIPKRKIAQYCAEGVGIEFLVETSEQIGLPALLTLAIGPKAGAISAAAATFTHYGHVITPLYVGWRIRRAIKRAQNDGNNYGTPNDLEHTV